MTIMGYKIHKDTVLCYYHLHCNYSIHTIHHSNIETTQIIVIDTMSYQYPPASYKANDAPHTVAMEDEPLDLHQNTVKEAY